MNQNTLRMSALPIALLQNSRAKWNETTHDPDRTLLRLEIMRSFHHEIHAERSKAMAGGSEGDSDQLLLWERQIENLRDSIIFLEKYENHSLEEVLILDPGPKRVLEVEALPTLLFAGIPKEKLARYDRKWELSLSLQACKLHWIFLKLETWIEISQAEKWNLKLTKTIWPDALVLYVEATGNPHHKQLWQGRWILLSKKGNKNLTPLLADILNWEGTALFPPSPTNLQMLYE